MDDTESEIFVGGKQDGMIVKQSGGMQDLCFHRNVTDDYWFFAHCFPHLDIKGVGIRHAVKMFVGSELIDFSVFLYGEVHLPCGFGLVFLVRLEASADQ